MVEQDRSFTVTDKRSSAEPEEASRAGEERAAKTEAAPEPARPTGAKADAARQQAALEVTFSSFVLSLSTSVMIHMGDIPDPVSGKKGEDLPAAKQMIDVLGIVKEKTRGNLQKEEEVLLQDLLYQLRMRYLEKIGQIKP
jgi:hypothetical protein